MSYGRDRDSRHRGIGAVAAADHLRSRAVARRRKAHALAARDAQLAGLTYGRKGGLAGLGTFEELGAINLMNTPMQNARTPVIRGGGNPEAPPAPPRGGNPYNPSVTVKPPVYGPPPGGARPVPPLTPTPPRPGFSPRPTIGPSRTVSVFPGAPVATPPSSGALCSRLDVLMGRCGAQPTPTPTDPGSGSSSGSGSSGGSSGGGGCDGSGAGVVTGGAPSLPTMTPPDDLPDMPDASSDGITVAGVTVPKTAVVVGGALLAGYLLFGRKR